LSLAGAEYTADNHRRGEQNNGTAIRHAGDTCFQMVRVVQASTP
jgi:hypothetical protein